MGSQSFTVYRLVPECGQDFHLDQELDLVIAGFDTCVVVVVHIWLLKKLINHMWEGTLTDVGLGVKACDYKV